MKWLNFWGLFLGLCASFLVTTESHAQLGKLLGGGKDDGGGGLGGLLDNGGSGGGLSNPMGLIGDALESAENTNLGPVGRYVLGLSLIHI